MNYRMSDIAGILHAESRLSTDDIIHHLLIDSRRVVSPGDSLFFALAGSHNDGHAYINVLLENGVRNFVVSRIPADSHPAANYIVVPDVLAALQQLTAWHRSQFSYPLIAVTGSNGKTIIKEWLFQLLSDDGPVIRNPRSYNSQIGVPLSVWRMDKSAVYAVFEAGISMPGEMEKLEKILKPVMGIFSNIGQAHQENFPSLAAKAEEKMTLFRSCSALVYCSDHHEVNEAAKKLLPATCSKIDWSVKHSAFLQIVSMENTGHSTLVKAMHDSRDLCLQIPFVDYPSVENAIHTWCLLLYMGYAETEIQIRINKLQPVAMRMEMKKGINNCTIINDSYNSDLTALSLALDFLCQQKQHKGRTLILSDIFQAGKEETVLYKEVADLLVAKGVKIFIAVGEALMRQRTMFTLPSWFYPNTASMLDSIRTEDFYDEAILIKGARSFRFEQVSALLEEKKHRTVLEIDLHAMACNLSYFRSLLLPGTKILAMVKALSYGSGTYEIANMLQFYNVDYLAVAFADEGVALRKAGIQIPIMVMHPEEHSYDALVDYNLEPEIFSLHSCNKLLSYLAYRNTKNFPVHIKIDSGMHRLGFEEHEISRLLDIIVHNKTVRIMSVFSHLAAADEPQHDDFTREQIAIFLGLSKKITEACGYDVLRHICNSAGIERFPEAHFDMVRLGIGLYGLSALGKKEVKQVATFKSYIAQLRKVKAHDSVGYSRKGIVKNDSLIAVVPVGYADGIDRRLGNGKASFLVNGQRAPVVGNICMDMCMIDVTDINAVVGDEVIIFGQGQPVTEIARLLDTISYEVLSSISARVPRIYFQE